MLEFSIRQGSGKACQSEQKGCFSTEEVERWVGSKVGEATQLPF